MSEENLYTFENEAYRKTYWHTCSHVMAQAVKRLYPQVKLAIGPSIDSGWYYDFDADFSFTQEHLDAIEAEMKKICKEKLPLVRSEKPRAEAVAYMESLGEPYKVELINDLPEDAVISFYTQGEFTDLCAGPHLDSTGRIKANAFKLTQCCGAYWRGDSKRKMLQRIYGIAFPKKEELDEYLQKQEEARKRDHNKLGRELEYFTTVDVIGQGLPILLPKGARVIQTLQRWVEDEEEKRGYLLTKTPLLAKRELYKISGHWDHYLDGMFVLGDPHDETKECFALRPMTCPFQYQVYLNRARSYRDLPMRLGETSTATRTPAKCTASSACASSRSPRATSCCARISWRRSSSAASILPSTASVPSACSRTARSASRSGIPRTPTINMRARPSSGTRRRRSWGASSTTST